jgi:hypothetical protein
MPTARGLPRCCSSGDVDPDDRCSPSRSSAAPRRRGQFAAYLAQTWGEQPDTAPRLAQPCRVTPTLSQPCALDDLMRKLLMVHRLLVAEERLARRAAARPDETAVVGQTLYLVTGP